MFEHYFIPIVQIELLRFFDTISEYEAFSLSMPLKVHVILHHYLEFFETFGETLLTYSDEITEAMHSQIRLFEDAHRYVNNQKGSNSHAKMQHRSTVHINSVNLGDR